MVLQNKIMVKIILGSKTEVVCARAGGANTTPISFLNFFTAYFAKQNVNGGDFEKRSVPKPARIPPQTPPAGGKRAEAKRKILSPRKTDFRFAESVLKPHALPRNFLGRTPKEKHPFLFQKKFHPRQIRNARSVFSFGVAGVLASAWGFLRAYDSVSSHHALRACDIICFENRFELGTINTHYLRSISMFSPLILIRDEGLLLSVPPLR